MEGISHEACSLAGTLRLSKLIALYDDNGIHRRPCRGLVHRRHARALRGLRLARDPQRRRPRPCAVDAPCAKPGEQASADGKPTLICCKTVIGMGSPNKAGTHDVHGARWGAEVQATREALGWTARPSRSRPTWRGVGRA
jgi:transketolase